MRLVTKAILSICIIVFSLTAIGAAIIYTTTPTTQQPLPPPPATNTTRSSFEASMDNWTTNGTDLSDPQDPWWINRTTTQAYDGTTSLQLTLDNQNDAGKIWIQRPFPVDPSTQYYVTVSYQFGTSDYGMNLFRIITAVTSQPPTTARLTYPDNTSNGLNTSTLAWLPKTADFVTTSGPAGALYVNIGVWGTWETSRTYYLDDVTVSFQKIPAATGYPDLTGNWTIDTYDIDGNQTNTTSARITQTQTTVTLSLASGQTTQGILIPNILPHPAEATDYVLWGCELNGQRLTLYIENNESLEDPTPSGIIQFTKG